MTSDKVRDEHGNHLVDPAMTFDITFPEDEGASQSGVCPTAIARTHDRLCTVSRTMRSGRIQTSIADDGAAQT